MKKPKVILLHRWIPTAVFCVVAAALMFWIVAAPRSVDAAAATRQLPIYCVQRDYKVCALTFDAAWGNEDTQTLVDILGRYQIHATFFVVGDWVEKYPESVRALHAAGHEVMNHSNDHAHFNTLSSQEIVANVQACNEKLAAVTGETPTLFRPPYGEYDDHVVTAVRSMGMEPIQWDVELLEPPATLWPPRRRRLSVLSPGFFRRVVQFSVPGMVNLHKVFSSPPSLPGRLPEPSIPISGFFSPLSFPASRPCIKKCKPRRFWGRGFLFLHHRGAFPPPTSQYFLPRPPHRPPGGPKAGTRP